MINPGDIKLVFSGGSSETPARDYIVRAGTSSTDARDYTVLLINGIQAATSSVSVSSPQAIIGRIYNVSPETGYISITGNPVDTWSFSAGSIDIKSYTASFSRTYAVSLPTSYISIIGRSLDLWGLEKSTVSIESPYTFIAYNRVAQCATSTVFVKSGVIDQWGLSASIVRVESQECDLKYSRIANVVVSTIYIKSVIGEYGGLGTGICNVISHSIEFKYNRIWTLNTATVSIGSGQSRAFDLGTGVVSDVSIITNLIYNGIIYFNRAAINITSGTQDLWTLKSLQINLNTPITNLIGERKVQHNTYDFGVYSPTANIISTNIDYSLILLGSGECTIAQQNRLLLATSIIFIASTEANLKNPYLVAIKSDIDVSSRYVDLRFIPTGYLPSYPPTSRSFTPPQYGVQKTYSMSGRSCRQLMCSKPGNAILALEYENIADSDAMQVIDAYEKSFGSQFGFLLPEGILEGSDADMNSYLNMSGSTLKWFFDQKPIARSVSSGVSSLSVQLKAGASVR